MAEMILSHRALAATMGRGYGRGGPGFYHGRGRVGEVGVTTSTTPPSYSSPRLEHSLSKISVASPLVLVFWGMFTFLAAISLRLEWAKVGSGGGSAGRWWWWAAVRKVGRWAEGGGA